VGYGSARGLQKLGLFNSQCADIGELAMGINKDSRGTWCAASCGLAHYSGKQIVHVGGEYLNRCPNCGSPQLFYDRVSRARFSYIKNQAERFMEFERQRKARKR